MEAGPLTVTPVNLYVEGPYDRQRWTRFSLINEHGKCQAFKIKSTRPEIIGINPKIGFIHAFDRIEIVVNLAGNCFDPMIPHQEKVLIQSTFTTVPCSLWTEASPREMMRNVAKPAEAKLNLVLLPGMPCKSSEKEMKSSTRPSLPTESEKQQNTEKLAKRGYDFNQFYIGNQHSDVAHLENDDENGGGAVATSFNDMTELTRQNKPISPEKKHFNKTISTKESNSTNQRNQLKVEVLKRMVSSKTIEEEFKTADAKKENMDTDNNKQHVEGISPSQIQSKNHAQFGFFGTLALALALAFGLGRLSTAGSTPL